MSRVAIYASLKKFENIKSNYFMEIIMKCEQEEYKIFGSDELKILDTGIIAPCLCVNFATMERSPKV